MNVKDLLSTFTFNAEVRIYFPLDPSEPEGRQLLTSIPGGFNASFARGLMEGRLPLYLDLPVVEWSYYHPLGFIKVDVDPGELRDELVEKAERQELPWPALIVLPERDYREHDLL